MLFFPLVPNPHFDMDVGMTGSTSSCFKVCTCVNMVAKCVNTGFSISVPVGCTESYTGKTMTVAVNNSPFFR